MASCAFTYCFVFTESALLLTGSLSQFVHSAADHHYDFKLKGWHCDRKVLNLPNMVTQPEESWVWTITQDAMGLYYKDSNPFVGMDKVKQHIVNSLRASANVEFKYYHNDEDGLMTCDTEFPAPLRNCSRFTK